MSAANASANLSNTEANVAAATITTPTKPTTGFLNGLFAKKPEVSANTNKSALNRRNRNATNLITKEKPQNETKKANSGSGLMASLFGASKPANKSGANVASTEAALNSSAAPNTSAAPTTSAAQAARRRTRKQRGGALRVPGPRNVLRVTGKTVRKLRNVGVYGLKKVGNGVHMVTGLLSAGTKLVGSVVRKGGKTLKGLVKRRQQTRRRS